MNWLPQTIASVIAYRYTESSLLLLKRGARDIGAIGLTWLLAVLFAFAGMIFLMGAAFLWLNQKLTTPAAALVMGLSLAILSALLIGGVVGVSRRSIKSARYALGK